MILFAGVIIRYAYKLLFFSYILHRRQVQMLRVKRSGFYSLKPVFIRIGEFRRSLCLDSNLYIPCCWLFAFLIVKRKQIFDAFVEKETRRRLFISTQANAAFTYTKRIF